MMTKTVEKDCVENCSRSVIITNNDLGDVT